MKLKRLADGAIIDVPDAKAATLLSAKDSKGKPYYGPVSDVETGAALTNAAEVEANNTVGAQVGNALNQVAGASSFGLLQDTSDSAKRLAAQHPYQTLAANVATAILPGSAENLAMNLGNKAFRVAEGASALRAGAGAVAGELISDTASSAVTALREDQSMADAFTDRISPLGLITNGLGTSIAQRSVNKLRGKAAAIADSAQALSESEQAVIKAQREFDDAGKAAQRVDQDVYAGLKGDLEGAAAKAEEGRGVLKGLEKQHKHYEDLQANVPIDQAKDLRDRAAWGEKEARRIDDITSGRLQAAKEAEVAEHAAKVEAQRASVYKDYVKDMGLKPKDFPYQAGKPDEAFERFLKDRGMGHLAEEGKSMGSLADRFQARITALGDDVPTTKEDMAKLFHQFAEDEGYQISKRMPARKVTAVSQEDNLYEGFYPEHGLRPLDADEAAQTFEFYGEIGQAGKRKMVLTADKARTLTPGRLAELREGLDPASAERLLKMASPTTRAHTLLHEAGLLRHASNDVLQARKLAPVKTSERAARLRLEAEDAFNETFTPTKEARVRAAKEGPAPLTAEDLDPTPRPYPHEPPTADYTANVQALAGEVDEIRQAVTHLDNLKLPKKVNGFVNMDTRDFDKMAESVRATKANANPDIAEVGTEIEARVNKVLSDMGVDVEAMVKTGEMDTMGVLGHVRKELRDQPARIKELKRMAAAELKAAKEGYKGATANAIANGGAATARQGRSWVQQAGGIFGRYMGSKALVAGAIGLGFSGNGLVGAAAFAVGGALGGTGGKAALSRKVMSVQALMDKAERGARLAEAIAKTVDVTRRAQGPTRTAYESIFEGKDETFASLFPNGKPADDSEAIYQLATENAAAFADPASHGYRSTGDMPFTNPKLALATSKSIERKTHALATIMPEVPPPGYNSNAGNRAPLHPEVIDQVKRGIQAIINPTDTLIGMLETQHFPQQELDLIRETNPDMYMETMFKLANELWAEDENGVSFINTLDQDVQDEYMNALGLDTLPGSAPGYTAFMQQMHATARQPKPDTLAKPLSNGSGYRAPSADNSNATNAQQATYR